MDESGNDDAISFRTMSPAATDASDDIKENPGTSFRSKLHSYAYNLPSSTAHEMNDQAHVNGGIPKVESEMSLPRRSARKRGTDVETNEQTTSVPLKKKRSTTKERAAADPHSPKNLLVDSLRPGLILVFIGLNPGLMTAATGHAYSHPSNLFWRLLRQSGITSIQHDPSETHDLMDLYSIGNTNICQRPTRSGDGLSKEELIAGAGTLEAKICKMKPEAVCIVGKSIWETIYKVKTGTKLKANDFRYGWQDEQLWLGRETGDDSKIVWPGSRTYVTTTTSGLAASMTPQQKLDIWKPLGDWFQQRRNNTVKSEPDVKVEDLAEEEEQEEENSKEGIAS